VTGVTYWLASQKWQLGASFRGAVFRFCHSSDVGPSDTPCCLANSGPRVQAVTGMTGRTACTGRWFGPRAFHCMRRHIHQFRQGRLRGNSYSVATLSCVFGQHPRSSCESFRGFFRCKAPGYLRKSLYGKGQPVTAHWECNRLLTVNEVPSTLSFVHIKAKDPTFQFPGLLVKVGARSQSDEFDSVHPALNDGLLFASCAIAEFCEGSTLMVGKVRVAAAAITARVEDGASARGFDGEPIAVIVVGPAVVSAISKELPEWTWRTVLESQCSTPWYLRNNSHQPMPSSQQTSPRRRIRSIGHPKQFASS
jgi:hypothetical protein